MGSPSAVVPQELRRVESELLVADLGAERTGTIY